MNTSDDACLSLALRQADRVVTQLYNRHLSTCGLRGTQYAILRAISETGCVTAGDLSEALRLDQTSVSRALKPLLRDGYIEAREGPMDRRQRLLCLTDTGREVFAQAVGHWEQAQQELQKKLGKRDSAALLRLSQHILAL